MLEGSDDEEGDRNMDEHDAHDDYSAKDGGKGSPKTDGKSSPKRGGKYGGKRPVGGWMGDAKVATVKDMGKGFGSEWVAGSRFGADSDSDSDSDSDAESCNRAHEEYSGGEDARYVSESEWVSGGNMGQKGRGRPKNTKKKVIKKVKMKASAYDISELMAPKNGMLDDR
jgi:hypothetical protein